MLGFGTSFFSLAPVAVLGVLGVFLVAFLAICIGVLNHRVAPDDG